MSNTTVFESKSHICPILVYKSSAPWVFAIEKQLKWLIKNKMVNIRFILNIPWKKANGDMRNLRSSKFSYKYFKCGKKMIYQTEIWIKLKPLPRTTEFNLLLMIDK